MIVSYLEAAHFLKDRNDLGWNALPFVGSKLFNLCRQLDDMQAKGLEILPAPADIFLALTLTPRSMTRAVIIGQDPYPRAEDAHGLAFSVPIGRPIPASLKTIFSAYCLDTGLPNPQSGCLIPWAKKGILLLNASLSGEVGKPNAHKKLGWHEFAQEIINCLLIENKNCLFLLWGNFAADLVSKLNIEAQRLVFSPHPSPLVRAQAGKGMPHPFITSQPFATANQRLRERNATPIDWRL